MSGKVTWEVLPVSAMTSGNLKFGKPLWPASEWVYEQLIREGDGN
jgi:hypothetical protein